MVFHNFTHLIFTFLFLAMAYLQLGGKNLSHHYIFSCLTMMRVGKTRNLSLVYCSHFGNLFFTPFKLHTLAMLSCEALALVIASCMPHCSQTVFRFEITLLSIFHFGVLKWFLSLNFQHNFKNLASPFCVTVHTSFFFV